MKPKNSEKTWIDITPDNVVPEAEVPERAGEIRRLTDDWLDENAQYFDLFDWQGSKEKHYRTKAFNEAGIYLLNALNHEEDDAVPALEELILDRVNDRRFVQSMLRHPAKFHHFVYPPLYANYVDYLKNDVATALKQIAEQGAFWSKERLPYRYLELCYLSRTFDIEFEHNEENILTYTLLNHQPNIVLADSFDVYSLTHDLMFSHYDKLFYNDLDVAGHNTPGMAASYDLANVFRGLILRFMAKDNADITLELLLTGILQKQVSRDMVRLVLSWVLEKSQTAGYVPGPPKESMPAPVLSPKVMKKKEPPWKYEYKDKQDETWVRNYHTNIIAGMTARVLSRHWYELDNRQMMDPRLEKYSFRRETMRLGQLLSSLADYDLDKGSQQMIELASSPVTTEFPLVFQEAVDFLEDQRAQDGRFGYWASEEIIYINKGNSQESFHNDLVDPVSETCQKALDIVESTGQK